MDRLRAVNPAPLDKRVGRVMVTWIQAALWGVAARGAWS